jgi:hypothetical protein
MAHVISLQRLTETNLKERSLLLHLPPELVAETSLVVHALASTIRMQASPFNLQ